MSKPFNESIEVFLSLIKWFLIILLLNNLIWAIVFIASTSSEETVLTQDGINNTQGINNGTIN